jgi:hypothetical protein
VNGRWQWGLKSRDIVLVLRRGTEGVVRLNGGEGEGRRGGSSPCGEGGRRPTQRQGRQNERSGGCFCSMKKTGEVGFG